jgi:Helix-turn-helix domain
VIRPRGGTTRRRDDQDVGTISSAEELGGLLREAREERGLDLLAVHDRLSRPITLLEALENGDLANLPDQALALSTLRRYAAFLGLDGDALALRMIDAWSASPAASNGAARNQAGTVTNVVTAVTSGPEHLRAFTQTGEVPKVGAGAAAGGSGAYGYEVATGAPTGTFPVVPRQQIKHSKRAVARARRKLRAPTSLKVITWVAAGLVLVVALGFGIQRWRPQWLVRSHVLRVSQPGSSTPAAGSSPSTGSHHASSAVVLTSSSPQGSSYTVANPHFVVNVATSGKCWVQVLSSQSVTPVLSGVQPAGKVLAFPAKGVMTVQVGASAVVVGVSINGKAAFLNSPHSTPYLYTFTPAPAS